jgi:hypothetical protein
MKKLAASLTLLALTGILALPGCAKKQEPAGTSTDSTLSLGDVPNSTSPAPESTYAPGTAPAPAPVASPTPTTASSTPTHHTTKPSPKPAPKPAPGMSVPAGTAMAVALDADVSTKDKNVGDTFTGTLAQEVSIDGKVVFPAGSKVNGHVAEAQRPGKMSGRGKLQLSYDSIEAEGHTYNIDAMGPVVEGKSGTAGDATKVVGGAAAGAILGKLLGGKIGTGAAIGAAAGGAAAMASRGPDPVVKAGTAVTISLDHPVEVKTGI